MDSLLKYGKVSRGYLGTVVQELTPDLAEQFKVPDDQQGALIAQVSEGSAAEKAGLQNGDIITAVNGKAISDPHSLRLTVGGMTPGDKVTVTYLRDGQTRTADVTLGSQGTTGEISENTPPEGKSNVLDGITVGDLDDSSRTELKVPGDVKGVLVTDVASDSVGYDVGLRKGDVILEMDRKALTSADEAVTEGNKIEKTERVLLHVWSGGKTEYLVLKPRE
jgi:serine protease Do